MERYASSASLTLPPPYSASKIGSNGLYITTYILHTTQLFIVVSTYTVTDCSEFYRLLMYSFRTNNSVAIYDGSIDCHLVFENRKFLLFKLSVLQSRTGTSVAQSSERCPLWISSIRFSLGTSDRYAKKVSQDLESRIGFLLVFCSHPRTGHRITFIEAFP